MLFPLKITNKQTLNIYLQIYELGKEINGFCEKIRMRLNNPFS